MPPLKKVSGGFPKSTSKGNGKGKGMMDPLIEKWEKEFGKVEDLRWDDTAGEAKKKNTVLGRIEVGSDRHGQNIIAELTTTVTPGKLLMSTYYRNGGKVNERRARWKNDIPFKWVAKNDDDWRKHTKILFQVLARQHDEAPFLFNKVPDLSQKDKEVVSSVIDRMVKARAKEAESDDDDTEMEPFASNAAAILRQAMMIPLTLRFHRMGYESTSQFFADAYRQNMGPHASVAKQFWFLTILFNPEKDPIEQVSLDLNNHPAWRDEWLDFLFAHKIPVFFWEFGFYKYIQYAVGENGPFGIKYGGTLRDLVVLKKQSVDTKRYLPYNAFTITDAKTAGRFFQIQEPLLRADELHKNDIIDALERMAAKFDELTDETPEQVVQKMRMDRNAEIAVDERAGRLIRATIADSGKEWINGIMEQLEAAAKKPSPPNPQAIVANALPALEYGNTQITRETPSDRSRAAPWWSPWKILRYQHSQGNAGKDTLPSAEKCIRERPSLQQARALERYERGYYQG